MASNTYTAKGGKGKKILGIVAGILIAAIILGLFVFAKLSNSGFFLRHTVSVSSENYEVNNAMMSYFFATNYSSAMAQNSSLFTTYYGFDTSKSLKSQEYPGGGTWYDYFMQSLTVPSVERMLVLCEAARADGYSLTDEDKASIDEAIETIKSSAASSGYSLALYVMNYYGAGVNIDDVRDCMELTQLSYSYYQHIIDGYNFSEAEWDAHYAENEKTSLNWIISHIHSARTL